MLDKTLNSSTLKIIALFSMLLDHIGYVLIHPLYMDACWVDDVFKMGDSKPEKAILLYNIYLILRIIGRLAYPIFSYMIVEGFLHTHNIRKYLARLIGFAIITEVPYDLAFSGSIFDPYSQNVLWTFSIAVIMLYLLEKYVSESIQDTVDFFKLFTIVGAAMIFSAYCDGSIGAILLIASMYVFRNNKRSYWIACLLSISVMILQFMWIQIFSAISLILLEKYNGRRGQHYKYLFYIFYPAHLILLVLISSIIF